MPAPGDPYANAFIAEHMKCWRMIHDRQRQAAALHGDAELDRAVVQPLRRPLVASVGVS